LFLTISFFVTSIWITRNHIGHNTLFLYLSKSFLGFFYCALLPSSLIKILLLPKGDLLILSFLCIVFAGDSLAYFGGRQFGKHKLMPSLSPNKTLEGALSGLIGSLTFGYFLLPLALPIHSMPLLILGLILISIAAQTGDLFESMLKRVAQVKDSGNILPGHGGILDRLDGVYFSAPLFFILCSLFLNH